MKKTLTLALLLIVAFYFPIRAQVQIQKPDWNQLEVSINEKRMLLETEQQLKLIKSQALQSGNDVTVARSLYNLLRIRDQRTEDTLYFKNSAFLDTLLSAPASPALKAMFHLMRAQRISKFDVTWHRFNYAAYRSKAVMVDYGAYGAPKRDSVVAADLQAALNFHGFTVPFQELSWLSSNPDIFLFKAQFSDLVYAEQVSITLKKASSSPRKMPKLRNWLSLSSTAFIQKLDSLSAQSNTSKDAYVGYRDWLSFHHADPEISSFIESLLRKHIYLATSRDSLTEKAYIKYLTKGISSEYPAFKAHSIYQLCLFYYGEGDKYGNFNGDFYYGNAQNFNRKYQYYPAKALDLYEQERQQVLGYPIFYHVLTTMATQIRSRGVRVKIEDKHLPGQPIPLTLTYKNVQTLYYQIVRVSQRSENVQTKQGAFKLPLPPDHNQHALYLKLDPLPVGRYQLLFSSSSIQTNNKDVKSLDFEVTNIAVIHADKRLFVLDRTTGFPLVAAHVTVFKQKRNPVKVGSSSTSLRGYVDLSNPDADSICVSYKGDTTGYAFSMPPQVLNTSRYTREEYDNLNDYYDDQSRVSVFTDRSIYRPGQTVQYKLIYLTRNAKTGLPMLVDRKHIGDSMLKLQDPASRIIDSTKVQINEFGSFAGSFVIPKSARTGTWHIAGASEEEYQNSGSFRVEEYKRPTIELSMIKQKKMLVPGQAFVIKLKLRTFNGAQIGNTPVHYTLLRTGQLPSARNNSDDDFIPAARQELLQRTGYTDNNGELQIQVLDSLLSKEKPTEAETWYYTYELEASALAGTGETSRITASIPISSRPINISMPVEQVYDRQALPKLPVSLSTEFEGVLRLPVHVKIYRLNDPGKDNQANKQVDQWYYPATDWSKWFPDSEPLSDTTRNRLLVLDTLINPSTTTEIALDKTRFDTGFYEINAQCIVDGRTLGSSTYNFRTFDSKAIEAPKSDVNYLPKVSASPGEVLTWYSSGKTADYTIYQVQYVNNRKKIKNIYVPLMESAGMRQWQYPVPADATGQLCLYRTQVKGNEITTDSKSIPVIGLALESVELVMEKYRKVMAPATQETFSLSLKTKNARVAGELMTTLYDASLDKIEPHGWYLPDTRTPIDYLNANWDQVLTRKQEVGDNLRGSDSQPTGFGLGGDKFTSISNGLSGRVAGLNVTNAMDLAEVVVVGYGTNRVRSPSGAVSRTKGPIGLPAAAEPLIKIRKNFNETAFFFPQLHVDRDGFYKFTFTMPDAATEWNWKMLAHTHKAQFAYAERKLQTQLNLMVQPNMPRLLYQGDKIKLQSRISNLDSVSISGTVTCKIEDAVTGEDLTAVLTKSNSESFNINTKSNGQVSFLLQVPAEQTNPLKIIIAARSGSVSDAEEHIIPVLSSKVFVRQSQPLHFNSQASLKVSSIPLQASASLYGLSLSISQKPEAAIFNALPWLANYSYDCAEQTFNKLRAEVTALNLVQKDSTVRRTLISTTAQGPESPANKEVDENATNAEASPWLNLSNQVKVQQKALVNLLDPAKTKINISKHLERLYGLQQSDGGITWFDGGKSNAYMSAYILAGFAQLQQQGWLPEPVQVTAYDFFIFQLLMYQERRLSATALESYSIYELYAMLSWNKNRKGIPTDNQRIQSILNHQWAQLDKLSLDEQAMLIICSLRFPGSDNFFSKKAMQQLQNIREASIEDSQNGLRWKAISDTDDLNNSAEETMALLADAFHLSGRYKEVEPGMLKWLLTAKQDEHWSTTKGTAAAIYMLENSKPAAFADVNTIHAEAGGKQLSVSNGLLTGDPYAFTRLRAAPATIQLESAGKEVNGALNWYYFANSDGLDTLNRRVQIRKEYYRLNADKTWVLFTPETVLKAGEQIRVRLTIESASRLTFVQLKDPRAAAFEPDESKSGYAYGDGFSYYRSVRDSGLDLFFEQIPKGISVINYELTVAHSGEFKAGPVWLTCMYQPNVNAYSRTQIIKVN